ncbi:MAG: Uma2 family endonuclease [Blastocatellia bacterium]
MALPQSHILYTVEEYLEMDRQSEERHVYLDGYVWGMAGESVEHGDIVVNLTSIVAAQLRDTPCRARVSNPRVRSGPAPDSKRRKKGLYSYPDVLIVCGEMQFHDEYRDVLINPTVVFEVLSGSTERFDRGEKFMRYQVWNPSLSDYVLVSQTSPVIERYCRQPDGTWSYQVYRGLNSSFTIESVNCILRLADIYDRVVFQPEDLVLFSLIPEPESSQGDKKDE